MKYDPKNFIVISELTFFAEKVPRTLANWNIFRVTGPLCGESTGDTWIPLTEASDVELWCFLWSASEQSVE